MGAMERPPVPPPTGAVRCPRHPDVDTGLRCIRCGTPICPDCMVPAAVGHQCPDCVASAKQDFRRPARDGLRGQNARASLTNLLLVSLGAMYVLEVVGGGATSLLTGPGTLSLIRLGASIGLAVVPGDGPVGIAVGQEWRLFTAMFLHAGIFHLLMNGYALSIFGSVVEQELGRVRFLLIYMATGLAASAASYAFGEPNVAAVGASGAIFGLFGAFYAYSLRRRSMALYAARVRGATTLIAINLIFSFTFPNVDWRAHLGGLVAGFLVGLAADAPGRATAKRMIFGAAIVALLLLAAGLTAWRTDALRSLAGLA